MMLVSEPDGAGLIAAPAMERSGEREKVETLLAAAWSAALRGRQVDRDRPYWELGVNANRALSILRYIWLEAGIDLPVNLFIEAPTVRAMAARMCDGTAGHTQAVPRMAGAGDAPALFLFPGGGGFLHELSELARAFETPGAIYGVTACEADGGGPSGQSHHAEAARAAALIRRIQPHGPYNLAGYSLGGCTAIETARLLRLAGHEVGLMLLDTGLNDHCWPVPVWLRYMALQLASRVMNRLARRRGAGKAAPKPALPDLAPRRRGTMFEFRFRNPRHPDYPMYSPHWLSIHPPAYTAMRARAIVMRGTYRPARYDGKVTFFLSRGGDPASCSPLDVWPRYLPNTDWVTVSGSHTSMIMGRHAKLLAAEMTKCLKLG